MQASVIGLIGRVQNLMNAELSDEHSDTLQPISAHSIGWATGLKRIGDAPHLLVDPLPLFSLRRHVPLRLARLEEARQSGPEDRLFGSYPSRAVDH